MALICAGAAVALAVCGFLTSEPAMLWLALGLCVVAIGSKP